MKTHRLNKLINLISSLALLTLVFYSAVQAEYTKKLIMLGGQDAPGIPGAKFSSSFPPNGIALSDNGRALFSAYLEEGVGGITFDNNEGIWIYEADSLRLLVQKGGAVPRFTQVQLFSDALPEVFMGPNGQIAMDAWYSPDGTATGAVHAFFIEENGKMFQKFVSTEVLPSGDTLIAASIRAFNAGRILFTGGVKGPTVIQSQAAIIAEYGPDGFNILSQSGNPLPGVDGGWLFSSASHQKLITEAGKTIFSVQAGRMTDNSSIGVVYSWDPVAGHIPLRVSAIDETFGVFGLYNLNTQGNNVNKSWHEVGVSYSLFDTDGNTIITEGDLADGAGGATFTGFVNYGLYDNDSIVIQGSTSDGDIGIWGGDVSGVKKIALVGDPAPGRPGDFVFWRVNNMEINRNGQVAFSDLAVDLATDSAYVGVWIGRTVGGLQLITQTGDTIEVSPGNSLTLEDASVINSFRPRTGADGLSSGLNDNGDILLFANFQGGEFGLMIASPGGMVVNSNGDDPDIDPTDGICDTGNELPNGEIECTLRAAIMEVNAQGRSLDIAFDIEGNTTISPQSALPAVRGGIVIDGNTQPDQRPIVIDGVNAGAGVNGLELTGAGSIIVGLEIGRFTAAGIKIVGDQGETSDGHKIIDCYIGLRSDSPVAFGNLGDGVNLAFAVDNWIGSSDLTTTTPGDPSKTRHYSGWNYISGNARDGIRIASNSAENFVWHNVIGLREDGTTLGNGQTGVMILDSDKNIVGGVEDQERNIISGNTGAGIIISTSATSSSPLSKDFIGLTESETVDAENSDGATTSSSSALAGSLNIIINNFIGLNKDGMAAGNGGFGIAIFNDSTLVGGIADSGNVISENGEGGISIRRARGTTIRGNYIGVDTIALMAMGNHGPGVEIGTSIDTRIGGVLTVNGELFQGNIISGNDSAGIDIFGVPLNVDDQGADILGNFIGVGIDNNTPLPNYSGVSVFEATATIIGGGGVLGNQIRENKTTGILLFADDCSVLGNRIERNGYIAIPGKGTAAGDGISIDGTGNFINFPLFPTTQFIARNNGVGVRVLDAPNRSTNANYIEFNSIFANVNGGIDLDPVGPNSNDHLDTDSGANDGQNSPQLLSVMVNESNQASILGILRSKPNEEYSIVAYSNDVCDASGLGQGQLWIGNALVTTNALGDAQIEFTTPPAAVAPTNVTLTATDQLGSTSEFSNCGGMADKRVDLVVDKSDDSDSILISNVIRYKIAVANHGADTATGVTLIDSLPSQISYVSDTSDHGPCIFSDGILTCDLGKMPPGDSATVVIIANVNAIGLIENSASAFASEGDENPIDNISVDSTIAAEPQTSIGDDDSPALPKVFSLSHNYPNPFNPNTVISYALPRVADVVITIYNVTGQTVRLFDQGQQSAGRYSVTWDATDDRGKAVASGIYFFKISAGDFHASRKMLLLK